MTEKKKAKSFGSDRSNPRDTAERWLKVFESEFKIYEICRKDGLDWKIQGSIEGMVLSLLLAYYEMGHDYRKITERVAPIEFSDPNKNKVDTDSAEG
jgi:hypothetical protein